MSEATKLLHAVVLRSIRTIVNAYAKWLAAQGVDVGLNEPSSR